jgi:tape measure domain-containing protein
MATISNNEIKIKYSLDTTDLANATALFDRLSAEDRQLLNDLKRLQAQLNATGQAGQAAGRSISGGSNAARGSITDLQNRVKDLTNRLNNLNPAASNYETILVRLQRAQANLNIATAQLNSSLGKNQKQFQQLGNSLSGFRDLLIGAFSAQALLSFGKAVLDTTIKMEGLKKAIEFTAGSAIGGAADFRFLQKIAEDLGLPLESAAEGFKSFSAAANRAGITVMQQRQMFKDLSSAMAALQLDSQSAGLVFFGFGQLMAKAKVSAQELYHQIGERLPIAMQAAQIAAARITGQLKVTSGQLIKLVEDGKLLSTEFAPEFTKALGELSKSGAYVETLGKDVNRLSNSWEELKASLGDSKALGSIVNVLKSIVDYIERLSDASNYYAEYGLFPEISFKQFKKFEKEAIDTYDKVASVQETKFQDLININKQWQQTQNKDTEEGELYRFILQAQYNEKRKKIVQDLVNSINQEEKNIKKAQDEIARTVVGIGPSANKDRVIQLKQDIKVAESAKAAFEKMYGDIPEFATFLPDPELEAKRAKALEDKYRKIIAAIEARKTAEDDRIKASTRDGYTRDIKLLENNVKFNKEMLAVDESAEFKKLELAKNNAVKRRGENERDNQEQLNIRKKALDDALKIEQDYFKRTQDKLDENALKRRQAKQTELQIEIEDIKKKSDDQVKVLIEGLNKEIQVQEIGEKERAAIVTRYNNQITKIKQDSLNQQLQALKMYYDEQEKLDEEAAFDRNEIYIDAATRRLAADAKNEYDRQDILDQGALADITNNRNRLLADEKRLKTTLGLSVEYRDREAAMIKAKLADLAAQEYEIQVNAEKRKQEKMLEIVQASADAMSQIFNDLTNLYIANLDREQKVLQQKYDADVRLADGNKQKLAQLAQEKARKEYEIELKQFKARQLMAVAEVIFKTAPEIARWIATGVLAPVAAIGLAAQAFAIGAILAQPPPVPPYKDGTKGRPHPGGPALVGEAGTEKVITTDGQVYFTPPMATLVDLPRGAQVIPNHALSRKELFMANALNQGKPINPGDNLGPKLDRIGGILESLPVHQVNMNERGFEKFVRTPRRTTKILNNQFPVKH